MSARIGCPTQQRDRPIMGQADSQPNPNFRPPTLIGKLPACPTKHSAILHTLPIALFLLSTGAVLAQSKPEEPVGLVLTPGGAKLLRAGVETPLAAKP